MNGTDAAWNAVCDRCERVFDRAESLLDEGGTEEALRLLQQNEAELRRLARPAGGTAHQRDRERPVSRTPVDGAVVVPASADYASVTGTSVRLAVLVRRTGCLLRRCEARRDRTAEELRLLRTGRGFQSGPSVAGAWFTEVA
jgi:hypothetical protein